MDKIGIYLPIIITNPSMQLNFQPSNSCKFQNGIRLFQYMDIMDINVTIITILSRWIKSCETCII